MKFKPSWLTVNNMRDWLFRDLFYILKRPVCKHYWYVCESEDKYYIDKVICMLCFKVGKNSDDVVVNGKANIVVHHDIIQESDV